MVNYMFRTPLVLPLLIALAGCSPVTRTHGNIVEADRLQQINPGVSQQADVVALLGTPSAEGTFDPNEWYYVGQVTEQTAFMAPEVVKRDVVRISFNPANGTVEKVERLDQSNGQYVEAVDRTTPTAGHDLGFVEQVLGNVGRFSPPNK